MSKFEEYANKYKNIKMERRDGILQLTLHHNDGPVIWDSKSITRPLMHWRMSPVIAANRAVILTATGNEFIAQHKFGNADKLPAMVFDEVMSDARRLIMNHLDVEVPMIAAVNGPALIHAEFALLCDVVVASDNAVSRTCRISPVAWFPAMASRSSFHCCSASIVGAIFC